MGLLQAAYRTYEGRARTAGEAKAGEEPLTPVSHIIQNAQIELTILSDGAFSQAKPVPKADNKTIIPATEESSIRTGDNERAHPLCDQLRYLAPYGGGKFEAYCTGLRQWAESPHTHPKVRAVLSYIQGGTILTDLQSSGLIALKPDGTPAEGKIEGTEYGKCLVRWRVIPAPDGIFSACWEDTTLFDAFIGYSQSLQQKTGKDLCMITGELDYCVDKHPGGIFKKPYKAKLLSSDDKDGFTYRGRFTTPSEAFFVGYTASQKAHSALRWLTSNHGTAIDSRSFLWWNPNGKPLPDFSFLGGLTAADETDTFVSYREQLRQTLGGYRKLLNDRDDAVVAALDAATTGRLSVTYYSELRALDLLDRLESWYDACRWGANERRSRSPSLRSIAQCAFGTQRDNYIRVDDRILKEYVQQLLHCVIDRRPIPVTLERALLARASQPLAYNAANRAIVLFTACAVIRAYRNEAYKEEWTLSLDENNRNRSYLLGRLLAVAEHVERSTYSREESREPNAIRMQSMFSQRPFETWRRLDEKLNPYYARLNPGLRQYFRKITQSITDMLDPSDPELNKALEDCYLLGYYHQRAALTTKKETENTALEGVENESEE